MMVPQSLITSTPDALDVLRKRLEGRTDCDIRVKVSKQVVVDTHTRCNTLM